ncbi:hypothetical protein [Paraliomyxa miuraensis]|uniref:hypothetical protein n=1 Tax=Paraliomyxa miuraensis TaxID=376150 RepID=UPI002258AE10|nr:hypothetical protein [Paraliomyxa miuraensis]MCX4241151.1 hypothetical protein [Paraliomyxa miuraensis]
MKRIQVELLAVGFALGAMALFADHASPLKSNDSMWLTEAQARGESMLYLDGPVEDARFDRVTGRWRVTDGQDTAWLDARSGELLEVELDPGPSRSPVDR